MNPTDSVLLGKQSSTDSRVYRTYQHDDIISTDRIEIHYGFDYLNDYLVGKSMFKMEHEQNSNVIIKQSPTKINCVKFETTASKCDGSKQLDENTNEKLKYDSLKEHLGNHKAEIKKERHSLSYCAQTPSIYLKGYLNNNNALKIKKERTEQKITVQPNATNKMTSQNLPFTTNDHPVNCNATNLNGQIQVQCLYDFLNENSKHEMLIKENKQTKPNAVMSVLDHEGFEKYISKTNVIEESYLNCKEKHQYSYDCSQKHLYNCTLGVKQEPFEPISNKVKPTADHQIPTLDNNIMNYTYDFLKQRLTDNEFLNIKQENQQDSIKGYSVQSISMHSENGEELNVGPLEEPMRSDQHETTCKDCNLDFKTESYFKQHMKVRHGICNICGKAVGGPYKMERHMRTHTGEKPFSCPQCEKRFAQKSGLKYHLVTHSSDKPYKCSLCPKTFKSRQSLNTHIKTHNKEKSFVCEECGKCFSVNAYLRDHRRTHTGLFYDSKECECNVCGKKFKRASKLKYHLKVHFEEKQFKCEHCEKRFREKYALVAHARVHTGERPFECEVCGSRFRHYCNLLTHLNIHSEERKYECKTCGKKFKYCNNLIVHMKIHLKGK